MLLCKLILMGCVWTAGRVSGDGDRSDSQGQAGEDMAGGTLDPRTLHALAPKCGGLNKAGEPCGAIASGGSGRCAFHGGPSKSREAATRARRLFYERLRPRLTEIERADRMLQALPYAGRVIMAEAMIAARETRDPMIAIEARRAMEWRYVGRLTAAGWAFGLV